MWRTCDFGFELGRDGAAGGVLLDRPKEKSFAGAAVLPEAADVALLLFAGLGFEVFALVLDEHAPSVGELGGEVGEEAAGGDRKAVGGWAMVEVANPILDLGAFVNENGAVELLPFGIQFADFGVEVLAEPAASLVIPVGLVAVGRKLEGIVEGRADVCGGKGKQLLEPFAECGVPVLTDLLVNGFMERECVSLEIGQREPAVASEVAKDPAHEGAEGDLLDVLEVGDVGLLDVMDEPADQEVLGPWLLHVFQVEGHLGAEEPFDDALAFNANLVAFGLDLGGEFARCEDGWIIGKVPALGADEVVLVDNLKLALNRPTQTWNDQGLALADGSLVALAPAAADGERFAQGVALPGLELLLDLP